MIAFTFLIMMQSNFFNIMSFRIDMTLIGVAIPVKNVQLRSVIIFRNKLTTLLVFERLSLVRNGQLGEFVYILC